MFFIPHSDSNLFFKSVAVSGEVIIVTLNWRGGYEASALRDDEDGEDQPAVLVRCDPRIHRRRPLEAASLFPCTGSGSGGAFLLVGSDRGT